MNGFYLEGERVWIKKIKFQFDEKVNSLKKSCELGTCIQKNFNAFSEAQTHKCIPVLLHRGRAVYI